jgi:hypothetical protein
VKKSTLDRPDVFLWPHSRSTSSTSGASTLICEGQTQHTGPSNPTPEHQHPVHQILIHGLGCYWDLATSWHHEQGGCPSL